MVLPFIYNGQWRVVQVAFEAEVILDVAEVVRTTEVEAGVQINPRGSVY